jgi:hypothetical protein
MALPSTVPLAMKRLARPSPSCAEIGKEKIKIPIPTPQGTWHSDGARQIWPTMNPATNLYFAGMLSNFPEPSS